jgi:hypothetical protein
VGLLTVVFVVTGTVVIAQRLSDDSLAMLVGGFAVLAMFVIFVLSALAVLWVWLRARPRRDSYQSPPFVIQVPQPQASFPPYTSYYGDDPLRSLASPRKFEVLGNDGESVG